MRSLDLAALAAALLASPVVADAGELAIYFENLTNAAAQVSMDAKPVCALKPSQRCLWRGTPAPSEAYVVHIEVDGGKAWDGLAGMKGFWPEGHVDMRVKPCDFVDGPTLHVKITSGRIAATCPDASDFF